MLNAIGLADRLQIPVAELCTRISLQELRLWECYVIIRPTGGSR